VGQVLQAFLNKLELSCIANCALSVPFAALRSSALLINECDSISSLSKD